MRRAIAFLLWAFVIAFVMACALTSCKKRKPMMDQYEAADVRVR